MTFQRDSNSHDKKMLPVDSTENWTYFNHHSIKEFFVFADPDGNVYHLTVEGSVVKDGARLSPPQHLSGITAMAWKNDWMALGDAEGAVVLWEWRTRHYRPLPQHRSAIRK